MPEPAPILGQSGPTDIEKAQLDFLWKQHIYVSDFIKFADAKCGFIISLNFGYFALLLSSFSKFKPQLPSTWHDLNTPAHIASTTALACLFFSIALAGWAIYPRLPVNADTGPISWIEVAAFKNADLFAMRAESLIPSEAVRLMARQIYYMASVCKRKHLLVQWSISLVAMGVVVSIVLLVSVKPN